MAEVSRRHESFCLLFYAVLLLITLSTIAATYTNHALFLLDFDSLNWSNAWLLATIINYYGAILCFCGVVVASEASWCTAVPWVMACCTVGSPACCLYVFLWLTKEGGSLKLERGSMLPLHANASAACSASPNLSKTSCSSDDTGKTTGSDTDATTEVTESRQQPSVSPATSKTTAATTAASTRSSTQQARKQAAPNKQQSRHHHHSYDHPSRLDRQLYRNHNHHYQHRHAHRDVERAIIS